MYTHKKTKKLNVLFIAGIFISSVILLILFAFIVKAIVIISQSRFDGAHEYVLQVYNSSKRSTLITFKPDVSKISIVDLSGIQAGSSASQTIQVPVDGVIKTTNLLPQRDSLFIRSVLQSNLTGNENITWLDDIRLLLFTQTVLGKNISATSIKLPLNQTTDLQITQMFTDQTLYREGKSVAIVNGSGISGLGTTVAAFFNHIGANVISVTTADTLVPKSSFLYTDRLTYTAKRLSGIVGVNPLPGQSQQIANIVFTIGTDKGENLAKKL